MSGSSRFKRNPAIHCWIKHLDESSYSEDEKVFYSIFGKLKRIRIITTIMKKIEKLVEPGEEMVEFAEKDNANVRVSFDLDDGTGLIRGLIDSSDPENFKEFTKGDVVDVVGTVSQRDGNKTLWIEIMKKINEPNFILLRNAEIINRIKKGDIQKIPIISDVNTQAKEIPRELEVRELFEDELNSPKEDNFKDRVFNVIKTHTDGGTGISFAQLSKESKLPDTELRTYINDLLLESRIYKSDEDNFEAF